VCCVRRAATGIGIQLLLLLLHVIIYHHHHRHLSGTLPAAAHARTLAALAGRRRRRTGVSHELRRGVASATVSLKNTHQLQYSHPTATELSVKHGERDVVNLVADSVRRLPQSTRVVSRTTAA